MFFKKTTTRSNSVREEFVQLKSRSKLCKCNLVTFYTKYNTNNDAQNTEHVINK